MMGMPVDCGPSYDDDFGCLWTVVHAMMMKGVPVDCCPCYDGGDACGLLSML